ncbi:MAG: hypothetical protein RLZZ543_2190 [Bacteroidota bacterium]
MPTLSKSRFVAGCQCEKKLFFDVYQRELRAEISQQQQAIFDTGHSIGALAQQVFPNGKDATEGMNGNWQLAIQRTKDWLQSGLTSIYEATFSANDGFAALDILHRNGNEIWAIEVKSSTGVKDYHLLDAAFQWHVMSNAGYAPDKLFLMHIDSDYVREGAIDPTQLFHLEDITEQVIGLQAYVQSKKSGLLHMLSYAQSPPQIEIGKQCSQPFECDYKGHCWAHIPSNSVFELYSPRGKDWDLYQRGIYRLMDIPEEEELNHRQRLQVNGCIHGNGYIDSDNIRKFISAFEGPLYFFDFETFNSAIPILNGTRPFQQIPFQYSLHVCDINGEMLHHSEFLPAPHAFNSSAGFESDPRYLLIQQLKKDIGAEGHIVAYNASFEISRLKELALAFPMEADFLSNLINRFVDLLVPFRSAWNYLPEMGKSASIKSVLPAIAPDFSYDELSISNGGDASSIYLSAVLGQFNGDWDATREALLRYCERDTEGMVILYRHLKEV